MDVLNQNPPASSNPEIAIVLQQVAHLQYQMQYIQAQNAQYAQHCQYVQQQLDQQVARVHQLEREICSNREKYNSAKEQNAKLKKQIEALKEDVRRQSARVAQYAQQEADRIKRTQKARQNAAFTNSSIPSAYKDAPPSMRGGYKEGPLPATPTPAERPRRRYDPESSDQQEPINAITLATVAASFKDLTISTNNDNRRKISYNNTFTGPSVANGSVRNSVRSFANNVQGVFGPSPPLQSRASNVANQKFAPVELPEDVPGTFAHAEKMLVKYKTREERLTEITNLFEALVSRIFRWSDTYINQAGTFDPEKENADKSMDLMRRCVEPLQGSDAEKWASGAITSGNLNFLVVAMIWRFLHGTIIRAGALSGMTGLTVETVMQVEEELRSTRTADIAPSRREKLISMRNNAVNEIMANGAYKAFRASKVKNCMANLRGCLKPFLLPRGQISLTAAGDGLNEIGLEAWDLLTETLKSDGIFILAFPRVRAQFLASSMRLAPYHGDAPFALNGCKIQLCTQPGFVFRDDTAGNVVPKQLVKPIVLVDERGAPTATLQ